VADDGELRRAILDEEHKSSMSTHLGTIKMYQDLERMFWWLGLKKDVASIWLLA